MLIRLNVQEKAVAEQIIRVQRPAYRIEADLIGFDGIPALKETAEQLRQSREQFWGYFEGERLAGVIAVETGEGTVDICRLVVHPDFHRRGIGTRLVQGVLDMYPDAALFTVSTGERNEPAISLYERFGFRRKDRIEIGPGIFLTAMEKTR